MISAIVRLVAPRYHVRANWSHVTFRLRPHGGFLNDQVDVYVRGHHTMSYDWIDGEHAYPGTFLRQLHMLFRIEHARGCMQKVSTS